ncbi:MAG TPA: gamma-glutamyltransferase [Candidatus Acetothermia bacterium]|nr:gamma-glutamyltransferase [Candidatus Acetothermia bacterium]
MVLSSEAMVATSQPLAVQVGIDVLKRGGNAIDAAIAVNATLGMVEPMSCGLGGDLFAIVWDARSGKLYGLNGSGRSPYFLTREAFVERRLDRIPLRGVLPWSVPGCVDGWYRLNERFGSMPIAEILAPAIKYAERGFPVSPRIARAWASAAALLREDPAAAQTFLPHGSAPACGEVFANPDLARSLRAVAADGRDAFYRGEIAEKIVATSERLGGYISMRDLSDHESNWVEPISARYRDYDVWELPPNTQGIAVLQMLRILDGFDLSTMGHNSADYLHYLVEAKKLAYEDRARAYADPDFYDPPVGQLLSDDYTLRQRQRIDAERASRELPPEDIALRNGDTVYLTVVDNERNAVSFIQSNYYSFGSGIVPSGVGFVIQNRGALFNLDPHAANRLKPHKRPFHTIIPGFVTRDGRPAFSFGVMGGDQQPQGQVQILCNVIDFGMDVQEAGDAFRFRHNGSSTPVGDVMHDGGTLYLEPGIPEAVADDLRARGHNVIYKEGGYGGYQGIWIDQERGVLRGGSESRTDGCASGY